MGKVKRERKLDSLTGNKTKEKRERERKMWKKAPLFKPVRLRPNEECGLRLESREKERCDVGEEKNKKEEELGKERERR